MWRANIIAWYLKYCRLKKFMHSNSENTDMWKSFMLTVFICNIFFAIDVFFYIYIWIQRSQVGNISRHGIGNKLFVVGWKWFVTNPLSMTLVKFDFYRGNHCILAITNVMWLAWMLSFFKTSLKNFRHDK